MTGASVPAYTANPLHDLPDTVVDIGWDGPVAELCAPAVLAIDGPGAVDWDALARDVAAVLDRHGLAVRRVDVRDHWLPWADVVAATSSSLLADDPDFERLASGSLRDLVGASPPEPASGREVVLITGPGSALLGPDVLWYADRPKRYAEADVVAGLGHDLGQRPDDGPPTTRRLFYVDWPLLDAHRDELLPDIDRWFDVQDLARPSSLDGGTLRRTLEGLAHRPVRTRPTFNSTSWGGQWGRRELGLDSGGPTTGVGYELIAPESGVLVGVEEAHVELPFQLVVAAHPVPVLGERVHEVFGVSFPIRFDYLDTVEGGNLSVHCHPRSTYMHEVFGWPYAQHETYYVVVGSPEQRVFLGLRADADLDAFRAAADLAHDTGEPFDVERWVQTFPAEPHQLFCIPAGTPHASGVGNVVLEVSATPYLYSLRFYDWLRRDAAGAQRPVHVGHAFANLDRERVGDAVATELVPVPAVVRDGPGWREEVLGSLPEVFFEVRRLVLDPGSSVPQDAADGFHVLNVVEGAGVEVRWDGGEQELARAETLMVPASIGSYELLGLGGERTRVVTAHVR